MKRTVAAVLATLLLALSVAPVMCFDVCVGGGPNTASTGCDHSPDPSGVTLTALGACAPDMDVAPAAITTPYRLQQRALVAALPFTLTLEGAAALLHPAPFAAPGVVPLHRHLVLRI